MWGYELTLSSDNPNITDNASRKSVLVTPGSVVVTPVIVITTGSILVTPGSVLVTPGSVLVTPGSVVVTPGCYTIALVISSAAPMVETTLVASPTAPDSSDGPPSQDPYVTIVARWRNKITTRSPSPSDFPIAPVTAPPGTRRRAAILIRPGEAIPLGRPYHTHPNGPRKVMTARKRVVPLPTHRLAWRRVSPRSSDHHPYSSSSSSGSSPAHSSGLDAPDQAHSGSSTRDVSLIGLTPEEEHHDVVKALQSLVCRLIIYFVPVDFVPSSTLVIGSLAPTRADLLPPCKRFRDSYSSEAGMEEDTEDDPIETEIDPRDVRDDIKEHEADTSAGDTVEVSIDPRSVPVADEESEEPAREDSSDSSGTRDGIVRSFEDIPIDLDDVVRDFYHHMSELRIDMIVKIETDQRRLEVDQLIARGERAGIIERIESLRLENLKVRAMLGIERDRVDSLRLHMSRS
ncbi:hypothetical protein Tco_0183622 [Tanacetum coccineum]